jgi:hypothetical protein
MDQHDFILVLNWTPKKWRTDKTIRSAAGEAVTRVNSENKQEAIEKSVTVPICRADERKAK